MEFLCVKCFHSGPEVDLQDDIGQEVVRDVAHLHQENVLPHHANHLAKSQVQG